MDKKELIHKVSNERYDKPKLLNWINCLCTQKSWDQPSKINKGDVLFDYKINRPLVVLKNTKKGSLCIPLTTTNNHRNILTKCSSRFYGESSFLNQLIIEKDPTQLKFIGLYDNNRHLTKILKEIKDNLKNIL